MFERQDPSAEHHVDGDLIQRLETLAGLRLAPGEREALAGQLDRIVAFVAQLQQLDTPDGSADEDAAQPQMKDRSPRRADQPRTSLARREVLSQAPATDGCFFLVPPVFMSDPGPWQSGEEGPGHE